MSSDQEVILDLYHALNKILAFTQNMDKQKFIDDEKTQSSVLYQIVIMGEAVNRLGSPDQRVIIKTYVEKQAKNRRRIFSKLRNP